MSLVEKCWMITSNVSVIAVLIITGICFGKYYVTGGIETRSIKYLEF